jgi:hypothetical protein
MTLALALTGLAEAIAAGLTLGAVFVVITLAYGRR